MTGTKSNAAVAPGWDFSFWFVVLSPVLGILVGVLALLLAYGE